LRTLTAAYDESSRIRPDCGIDAVGYFASFVGAPGLYGCLSIGLDANRRRTLGRFATAEEEKAFRVGLGVVRVNVHM
jgi:hypothetical protein